jgi:hypothetical protein
MAVPVQVVFDCHDPDALAHFWADLLGYQLDPPPPGYDSWEAWLTEQGISEADWNMASALSDPEGRGRSSSSKGSAHPTSQRRSSRPHQQRSRNRSGLPPNVRSIR